MQCIEGQCVAQSVASVVPGLEPLGIDLLAVSFRACLFCGTYLCPIHTDSHYSGAD